MPGCGEGSGRNLRLWTPWPGIKACCFGLGFSSISKEFYLDCSGASVSLRKQGGCMCTVPQTTSTLLSQPWGSWQRVGKLHQTCVWRRGGSVQQPGLAPAHSMEMLCSIPVWAQLWDANSSETALIHSPLSPSFFQILQISPSRDFIPGIFYRNCPSHF